MRLAGIRLTLLVSIGLLGAVGCASLPPPDTLPRTGQQPAATTAGAARVDLARLSASGAAFARRIDGLTAAHPKQSGVHPLPGGREAFAVRARLIESAEATLDLQYYLWRDDLSGRMLFDAVRRAADRGVHVRLLLDDGNTIGQDDLLAWLDEHPGIEVRLFNPFAQRRLRLLEYLGDFDRLQRRMHNKSLTADGQAAVIGGRNIGDAYFDVTDGTAFTDLDLLVIGPIVSDLSADFERYWNSRSSYPAAQLLRPLDDAARERVLSRLSGSGDGPQTGFYREALERTRALADLREGRLDPIWAPVTMISDDPAKVLVRDRKPAPVATLMERSVGEPRRTLEIVSPYVVPMAEGVGYLAGLVNRGVRVRILTNSLASTDVVAVHAGYARWREALLDAGVELFEYRREARPPGGSGGRGSRGSAGGGSAASGGGGSRASAGGSAAASGGAAIGSSGAGASESSLHAKTFSVDGERIYVGSANFDPRSAALNTELGFVVASPALTATIDESYARDVPRNAWRVDRDATGALRWSATTDDGAEVRDSEPDASPQRLFGAGMLSILPFDWLL
ncbi:MAG: phospholipase D family protein [Burkholderiaceae bacterium]